MPKFHDIPFDTRYEQGLRQHLQRRPRGVQTSRAGHALGLEAAALGLDAVELAGLHDRVVAAFSGPSSPPPFAPLPLRNELSAPAVFFLEVLRPVVASTRPHPAEPRSDEERSLTHRFLLAQENERVQCSRELGDEITQILVAAHLQLSALTVDGKRRFRDEQKAMARTQRLIDRSISALHRLAGQLHPAMLENLGLIPTLRALLADLFKNRKETIELSFACEPVPLAPLGRTVLYRVALEALTNIVRHARANFVWVSVEATPGSVLLHIRDDGEFADVPTPFAIDAAGRLGLKGMRERVEMMGGRFTLEYTAGTGTSIRAEIPSSNDHPTFAS